MDKVKVETQFPKHLLEAMEKAKPSSSPVYWAKKGCSDCYGRGIIGKQTIIVKSNKACTEAICHCVRKKYKKWQNKWLFEFEKSKNVLDSFSESQMAEVNAE